jgi:hypothetical protein
MAVLEASRLAAKLLTGLNAMLAFFTQLFGACGGPKRYLHQSTGKNVQNYFKTLKEGQD